MYADFYHYNFLCPENLYNTVNVEKSWTSTQKKLEIKNIK